MSSSIRNTLLAFCFLVPAGFAAAAATATDPVDRPGSTVSRWRDDKVTAVLGYRFAASHHKDWIVLQLALSANGAPFGFDRENLYVEMPDGRKVPLATQKELNEAMDFRPLVRRVQVGADPIGGYFRGRFREEPIRFFAVDGIPVVEDHVAVDHRTLRNGYLFFRAPGGEFPAGLYKLRITGKKLDVALPFELLQEQAAD
jgi:hypothetical protein